MCDLKPLRDVADDLSVLLAIGEILEEVTSLGGGISAEAVSGLGGFMRRTAQRIKDAHAEIELNLPR